MSIRVAYAAVVLLVSGCAQASPLDENVSEFRSLYNSRQFGKIYESGSVNLRRSVSAKDFEKFMAPIRERTGRALRSQALATERRLVDQKLALAVEYRTEFENLVTCEVFMFDLDKHQRIAGYHVRERAFGKSGTPKRPECGE